MTILVDTREQKPYWSGAWAKMPGCRPMRCYKGTLLVGDYSTIDLDGVLHIERKSGQDLYGTLTKGNVRFRKELIRAKENGIAIIVVVEQSFQDFLDKKFPHGDQRLFPATGFMKMIPTFESKYGLRFVWCKHRVAAKQTVYDLLSKGERWQAAGKPFSRFNPRV